MKIAVRRSCLSLIVLSALVEVITANENENSTEEVRKGRVSGRIVKIYSGYKPDPVLCTEEGFKADPVHCSVFYRCLKSSSGKFTVFKFQCGPGTVYDPETEVCNHASSTKRSECRGIKSYVEQDNENENEIEQHELPSPISTILPVYTSHANNVDYEVPVSPTLDSSGVFITSTENGYINSLTTSSIPYQVGTTRKEVQDINYNLEAYPWTDYTNTTQPKTTPSTTMLQILEKRQPCTSDGFMGDSENCKKFYRCVSNLRGGFIRYEFLCSEPTVWDDHMQSCNHPWAVRNGRCGRVVINNENHTEALHIIKDEPPRLTGVYSGAKHPEAWDQDSRDVSKRKEPLANYGDRLSNVDENSLEKNQINYGSHFNPPTMPKEDKNDGTQTNIHKDDVNNNYNFGQKIITTTNYMNNFAENSVPQFTEIGRTFICTHTGFVGDSNDCKKFYRCVENGIGSFRKYEFTCSQGTVWDKTLEACNYAWAVKECGGTSAVNSLITSGSQTSTSTSNNTLSENFDSGYTSQVNQEHELPTTISVSTRSTTRVTTAPNSPTTAFLTQSTTPEKSQDNNDAYGPQQDATPLDPGINLHTTLAPMLSQNNDCESTGFIGDTNDCKKFYRCVNNGQRGFVKYEFSCGEGTVWDPKIEACNHAWAVKDCGKSISLKEETSSSMPTTYSPINSQDLGIATAISSIKTSTPPSKEISEYDSGYGQQLSVSTKRPDSETTTLKQTHSLSNNCQASGFMGDVNNCNKFYRCVDNGNGGFIQHEYSCGEGTLWDPEIEACNHAWAVKLCGGGMPSKENILTSSTTNLNIVESNNEYVTQNYKDSETTTQHNNFQTTSMSNINENNECKTNGFMGDKSDCKKFYRCVDSGNGKYTKYVFSCGEGTLWDPQINACNHAWAVKGCGNSDNPNTDISVKPTSNPSNGAMIDDTTSTHHNSNDYLGTTISSSSTDTSITVTNTSKECKSSGFMGDDNDCQKFYRCVDSGNGGFIKYEFMCSTETVWDSNIEACNHKWAVEKCGSNSHSEFVNTTTHSLPPMSPVIESETTTLPVASSSSIISTTSENLSPSHEDGGCSSEGTFANPKDCKKFYRCVNDDKNGYTKYEFSCAEGTAWDVYTQSCNHLNKVKACQSSLNTTVIDEQTNIESDITKTTTLAPTSTSDNLKQNTCKEEGYFGDKNNCKKFYRCVYENDGRYTKYDFTCGDGTIWDQDIIACNHPYDVKNPSCTSEPESTSPVSTISTSTANNETPTPIPDTEKPASPTSEGVSNNNETNPNSNNNIQTNIESDTTKTTTLAPTSTSDNLKPNTCKEEGYFGDKNNCKKFYRCVYENDGRYTKYDFTCGDGTIWDQDITACNHPYDVKNPSCTSEPESTSPVSTISTSTANNETPTPITDTEKPASPTSEGVSNNNETNPNSNNSTTGSNNNNSKNFTCTKAGFYADPSNCKKFYRCVDWENNGEKFSIFHFDCADGTIWDPALETCNHEDSVYPARNCNGTQQQNENTTGTSLATEETTTTTYQSESTTTSSKPTKTTTQSTTTTEYSTTQTTQSPTTQSSSTKAPTTQSSTTKKPTTQSSTTKQPTTQSSTTGELTTQSSTTEESTTHSTTTEESTTHSTTTEESSTQSTTTKMPTTEETTTQQTTVVTSTTNEQSTQQVSTTTETDQEQTTNKLSTMQTTNEATTSVEPSTTTTQMTTSVIDQSSTTTEQSTSTVEISSSSTTESNQESSTELPTNQECPKTSDDQSLYVCPTSFKRHPKYCDLFYQCTEDNDSHELKIAVFNCPNNTIYDESKIQCVEKEKSSKKCNGQISQKNRVKRLGAAHNEPFIATKESMACRNTGHFPFEKNTECSSSLLKCELTKSGILQGFVYRCPEGFVYWNISRRCEPITKVRDCKSSSYPWKRRYDIPLEKFNIAP